MPKALALQGLVPEIHVSKGGCVWGELGSAGSVYPTWEQPGQNVCDLLHRVEQQYGEEGVSDPRAIATCAQGSFEHEGMP
eukprot:7696635-Alexandrium_andersonii.AAC.1